MLINPLDMFPEAEHLSALGVCNIWQRTTVDRDALIITPWQQAANRLRELARGDGRHGSCGQGVGETMADSIDRPDLAIRVKDIEMNLVQKLNDLRLYKRDQMRREIGTIGYDTDDWKLLNDDSFARLLCAAYRNWARLITIVGSEYLSELANQTEQLLFEGAQGVLLDEWYGFHPYTTWSTTTPANALQLLDDIHYADDVQRLGIIRAYTTRHGPGPFVTEETSLARRIPEYHNGTGKWQGAFRYGHLDLVAHQYAIAASGGIDQLVVTGMDRMDSWQYCQRYQVPSGDDRTAFFYFDTDGNAQTINVGSFADLEYQGRLTEYLSDCRPVYHQSDMVDDRRLLSVIEETLDVPIGLTSYGPSATDKRVSIAC
jgi:adenylosuccinate synthase